MLSCTSLEVLLKCIFSLHFKLIFSLHFKLISFLPPSLGDCTLIPKEASVLREHNLNFDRLCKLEKWLNGAEILAHGRQPSYLSNKTILTQNKFMVSEL